MRKYKYMNVALVVALCAAAGPALAADSIFSESVPLLCAPIDVTECDEGGSCYQGRAEDINLPQFIRVNLKEKMLSGVGDSTDRTTPIKFIERENGKIILHGGQGGRGWTAIISETGKLVATISDEKTAIIIFGACTHI
jgi:hypothetical protein